MWRRPSLPFAKVFISGRAWCQSRTVMGIAFSDPAARVFALASEIVPDIQDILFSVPENIPAHMNFTNRRRAVEIDVLSFRSLMLPRALRG
jgi:hypothetical protein